MSAMDRRAFVRALGTAAVAGPAVLRAQSSPSPARQGAPQAADAAGIPAENAAAGSAGTPSSASNVPMDPSGYKPVNRPSKPGARPALSAEQRDALEHRLKCQCPCTLDVYTCRTTDFSCGISPAMHGDVMRLVDGGYSADEIIATFQQTYGERVLMEPAKTGFNLAGYAMPFAALGTGALVVGAMMRRWSRRAAAVAAVAHADQARRASGNGHGAPAADGTLAIDATPDELARLEAAVRGTDHR